MRRAICAASLLLACGLVIACPRHARAEDAQTQAIVQALFAEARDLLKRHRYAEACPKLEEVLRLEPQGNGARMMLAECYDAQGRLASSWATYVAAESFARQHGQQDREARAHERAEALAARLSRLRVVVSDVDRPADLEVRLDGVVLGAGQWGTLLPVDGGAHVVVATARGRSSYRQEVTVEREGATLTLNVPTLAPSAPAAASSSPAASLAPASSSPVVAAPVPAARTPAYTPWALGGGAALVVASVVFALDLRSVERRQDTLCGGDLKHCARTTPDYDPASDNARKNRDFGLALGLGGAGLALSAVGLWGLLSPSSPVTPVARVGPDGAWIVGARVVR